LPSVCHIGDGGLHANTTIQDNAMKQICSSLKCDTKDVLWKMMDIGFRLALDYGACISSEHGFGRDNLPWILVYDFDVNKLKKHQQVYEMFDKNNQMNPAAKHNAENLRVAVEEFKEVNKRLTNADMKDSDILSHEKLEWLLACEKKSLVTGRM
jgi:hypothetical protein